jgi:hypothetical protein
VQLNAANWLHLLSTDSTPAAERVIIVVKGLPNTLRIRKDDWRNHFSKLGGISFRQGEEVEIIPAAEGGPSALIPDWARERLASGPGDAICITHRGERYYLKRLLLVEQPSQIPGCIVADRFEHERVVRTYWNHTALDQITCAEMEHLLLELPRFRHDPVLPFRSMDGRLGLLARREFLGGFTGADRSRITTYKRELCRDQQPNGSWEDSAVRTAFRLIRLVEVGATPREPAAAMAIDWLLKAKEPMGFPGLFMTSEKAVHSFNTWKARQDPGSKKRRHRRPSAHECQMYLDNRDILGVSNACYGCELKITWASAVAVEALLRFGLHEEERTIKAINTLLAMRHEHSARWCGCGNFVADVDYPETTVSIDFNRFSGHLERPRPGRVWMIDWCMEREDILELTCNGGYVGLALDDHQALVTRTARQGAGDCSMVVHRALSYHPAYHGSSLETTAALEYAYRQSGLGDWTGNYVSFFFSLLARARCPLSAFLVLRTVPLLVRQQRPDGLWKEDPIPYIGGAREARMVPTLTKEAATFMILTALKTFGFLDTLRPALP